MSKIICISLLLLSSSWRGRGEETKTPGRVHVGHASPAAAAAAGSASKKKPLKTATKTKPQATTSTVPWTPTMMGAKDWNKEAAKKEVFNYDFAPVNSTNVPFDCSYNNVPMCCQLTKTKVMEGRKSNSIDNPCTISKEYIPSLYEQKHYDKSKVVAAMTLPSERRKAILDFVTTIDEMKAVSAWLERVKIRMMWETNNPGTNTPVTKTDEDYLSRFRVTKTCPDVDPVSWLEWIEPLTVYSRHPFAFSQCGAVDVDAIWRKKAPRYNGPVTVFSVDHILTTTSQDFYRQTDKGKGSKILVFDAGSSVFPSSGSWLTCAYAQSGMFPDGVFSWERDYIDPTHYLDQIPPPMRPRVHFANVPVIAGVETGMISPRVKIDGKPGGQNPLKVIHKHAKIDDFVAFKLDIDAPSIEIVLAQSILKDRMYQVLIDEFFFELHFQCEFHEACWGKDVAKSVAGQNLDRYAAMTLFVDLRKAGIRAHFWP